MRLLMADLPGAPGAALPPTGSVLDTDGLARVYAAGRSSGGWLRTNFATSLDGAITGPDGRSGSVNSEADHVVFELLRALSHAVVVGAGTVRSEGYPALAVDERWRETRGGLGLPDALPVVAVSNRGEMPPSFADQPSGSVLLALPSGSPGLADARARLGPDQVVVCGDDTVDGRRLVAALGERGWTQLLCEGGPQLHGALVAAGVVDELCLSITPVVVGGDGARVTAGAGVDAAYRPLVLVEEDGTLMGRWVRPSGSR
ncbi:MAG: dihydrofolate reductase family protein [Lapillicoccus sp.]